MKKFNFIKIKEFIDEQSDASKIYIGCDSSTFRKDGKWYANFYKVIVVHKDGCHGCKIFGEVETEQDFTANKKKPLHRLMTECYKVSELYLKLSEITDRDIEVHLDINPDEKHTSSLVISQAIGYIRGTCNVIPMVKPEAFAASYAADRLLRTKVA